MSGTSYAALLRVPGARAFTTAGAVGRLPISMITLGSLLLVQDRTGSYAVGGAVSAAAALGEAGIGPVVSRTIDRRGQARVLPVALGLHALALVALVGLVQLDAVTPVLLVVGFVAGGLVPPVHSCVRARWSATLAREDRADDISTAMAWEAVLDEVVFIVGPVVVIAAASLVDPVAGLGLSLLFATIGCLGLATQRSTQPDPRPDAGSGPSALRLAGLRTLALMAVGVGTLFGASEVAMIAFADGHGAKGASGVLLGLLAAGSGVAGLAYGTRSWAWPLEQRLLVGSSLLVLGTVPLVLAPSLVVMGVLAFVAGLAVAPTMIPVFGLVERLVPGAELTEGFSWIGSGIGIGAAIGAALAGVVADRTAPHWSFAVCVGGAAVALSVVLSLRGTLRPAGQPVVAAPAVA